MMTRGHVATAMLMQFLPTIALAQDQSAQSAALKRVCRADYAAYCTGNNPAPPIERACLAQYFVNLSSPCQAALNAARSAASGSDQGGSQGNGQGGSQGSEH